MANEFIARKGIIALANSSISGNLTATSFIKSGGTSLQFLKADGTVDSSAYITSSGVNFTNLSANGSVGTGSNQVAVGNHTHNYAGSASAGGAANSVANNLTLKFNTGTTENTDLYTFNGSGGKTIDIKAGTNVTFGVAAGAITINANDTSVDYSQLTGTVPTWNQNTTGSAATLTTARTLTIGSTGKTFNGGADVSWSLAEIGAQAAGSYQPLDADLTAIAALSGTTGLLKKTAADTWTLDTNTYALDNQTMYIGTTSVTINRSSGALSLTGVSIDGNAGTAGSVTNSITFNTTGGAAAGTTYNGSAARTIDYSTVGAASSGHTHSYLPLAGGTLTGDLTLSYTYPRINLTDTDHNSDYSVINDNGNFVIYDVTNSSNRLFIDSTGNVGVGTTTPTSKLTINSTQGLGSTVLDIQGTQGQLFNITDSLTGDIFKVSDVSGIPIFKVNSVGLVSVDGDFTTNGQLSSTVANGTAPFSIQSSTLVTNLNVDLLDGQHGSYYLSAGNLTGTIPSAVLGNSSLYLGTTQIALNRGTGALSLTGVSIDGNAGTVTNGVYTTGSYSDPSWLTISKSKVGLGNVENTALSTWAGSTNITTIGAATATSLSVTGNLTVNGTTTTVHSTTVTLDDPILTLGGDTAPTVDDNKDRGIEFRWHDGTSGKTGFFGFDDSTGYFTFIPNATNTSEVFSGTQGDIQASNFRGTLIGSISNAITFNTTGGAAAGTTYNGSAARTIDYSTVGAAASSHTHNYAGSSSAGGAATSALTTVNTVTGTNSAELVRGNMADNDQFRILVGGTGSNAGYVEIATADDGTEPIYVRQYTGVFTSLTRTLTLLDGSGNTSIPGNLSVTGTLSASGYNNTNWDNAYSQRLQWDGGSTNLVAATGRTSLGATTVGSNLFTLANPSAITFIRINADNTVSTLDAATFRTAIGAGTGNGTVTSVGATSPVASSGGNAPTISLNAAYGDTLNPYGSKTANYFLAAPNGTAGAPTFRAIVAADIPTLNQNTNGSAAKWTTARTVSFATGDVTGSFSIDGSADVSNVNLQVADDSHNHSSSSGNFQVGGDLSVSGSLKINSGIQTSKTSSNSPVTLYTLSVSGTSSTCLITDYTVVNVSGTAQRSGTVTCNYNSTNITYSSTATPDLGTTTNSVNIVPIISSGNVLVQAIITGSDTWNIKISCRYI